MSSDSNDDDKKYCNKCNKETEHENIKYVCILGYGYDEICKKCLKKFHNICKCGNIRRKNEKILNYNNFCNNCKKWAKNYKTYKKI